MQMVATDLDGTIVGADQTVSPRTCRALMSCRGAGVEVVFVTGRPLRWMAPVVAATGIAGTAVCGNGAAVYDLAEGRLLAHHPVALDVLVPAVQLLRAALGPIDVALETLDGVVAEPGYRPTWDPDVTMPRAALPDLLADAPTVLKLLVRGRDGAQSDPMLALARTALDGALTATHSNAGGNLLELSAPGISKARTLADLVALRGLVPADVVAFGDQPNDVEMLAWAGRGFAMADGHPAALAAAHDLAPPFAEDGVAQILERLLAAR